MDPPDRLAGTVDEWLDGFAAARARSGRLLGSPRASRTRARLRAYPPRDRAAADHLAGDRARGSRPTPSPGAACSTRRASPRPRRPDPHRLGQLALRGRVPRPAPAGSACGVPVQAVPAGKLLTHPAAACLPPARTCVVSFARSGNSPESCAVLESLLRAGRTRAGTSSSPATGRAPWPRAIAGDPRVEAVVLDEKTEDRSLVMTSSFTNMVRGRPLARPGTDAPERAGRPCGGGWPGPERASCARDGDALAGVGAQRLSIRGLSGQRLPAGLRPRGGPQDAGDDRGPGRHA